MSWKSTKDGKHFKTKSTPGITSYHNDSSNHSGTQSSSLQKSSYMHPDKIKRIPTPRKVYHATNTKEDMDGIIRDNGRFDHSKAGSNSNSHANTDYGLYTSINFGGSGGVTHYGKYVIKLELDRNARTVDIRDIQKSVGLTNMDVMTDYTSTPKIQHYIQKNNIDIVKDTNFHDSFYIIVNNAVIKNIKRVSDQFDSEIFI